MKKDDMIMKMGIVHILDSVVGMPVLSDCPIDMGSNLCDFLKAHIEKFTESDDMKVCQFSDESEVMGLIQNCNAENFVQTSRALCEKLYGIMNSNIDIPAADVAVVVFSAEGVDYFGFLKLNYKTSYTHATKATETGENLNDIILQKAILPSAGQKLSEAFLVNLSNGEILLTEKKFEVNGEKKLYFSELFLECHAPMSQKTKLDIVTKAVEDAYHTFMMQHKYPFTAFHITIEPELLDVNVHPSKMELRFANSPYIYDCVRNAVMEALSQKELIVDATLDDKVIPPALTLPADNTNADSANAAVTELSESVSFTKAVTSDTDDKPARMPEPFETKRAAEYDTSVLKPDYTQLKLFERPELLKEQNKKSIKIIGQVFGTYWIIEFENNMYIIDQHAAHEKVLFERFMKRYKEHTIHTQYISPPEIIKVSLQEDNILKEHMSEFNKFGYEIESFGGDEYVISGIPADFAGASPKDLLLEILDDMSGAGVKITPDSIKDRIATMSCKAAVKGNNKLSYAEARELIDELMELDNPYNCPHGRPTLITMSKYELEKKFKRII